jgi:cell division protein FtsB
MRVGRTRHPASTRLVAVVALSTLFLLATSCSSDADVAVAQRRVTSAEAEVAAANAALEQAGVAFCEEAKDLKRAGYLEGEVGGVYGPAIASVG